MYVAVNVEPYDTMQIMLLYNKKLLSFDNLSTVYQNVRTERCLTALRCAAARLAAVAVYTIDCQQALPALRHVIVTWFLQK
jgi:hypothetical protein